MMENVPGLVNYTLFKRVVSELQQLGYKPKLQPVRIQEYGVPQRRRRLVLVGSLLGDLDIAKPTEEKVTVRDVIGHLEATSKTKDPVHRIVTVSHSRGDETHKSDAKRTAEVRADVPEFQLACHKDKKDRFPGCVWPDAMERLLADDNWRLSESFKGQVHSS